MKLYNTLKRDVSDFAPLDGKQARIYSCGPTVYDHAHIGNLSAYIFADTLRRVVGLSTGASPLHAMNYTDVDDKTIRRSRERYPNLEPRQALSKLTDEYISLFLDDMRRIGNDTDALTFVRATERIEGMKELIGNLHAAGFAYIADDGVYFSIDAYRKSGKVYGQLLEITAQNTSSERIENDEYDKDNIHDFALWKIQKDGEPAWDFTLAGQDLTGRPGWHIECSVMSRDELGQPFDIHTGGVDLIFPHHENEIAQSTAIEENPVMAQVFAHNEHILVDGKKMSKSLNNFYTLQDIVDKGFDPLAFRLLVLQAHYRSQVHFSWENLEASQNRLKNWQAFADLRFQPIDPANFEINELDYEEYRGSVKRAVENDIDTPQALRVIDLLANERHNSILQEEQQGFGRFINFLDTLLGLQLSSSEDINDEQRLLIQKREEARGRKDWAKSDEVRGQLEEQGIGLRDTEHGTIWYRL